MINISTVAYQAREALHSSGIDVSQTAMLEMLATLLGYGTYAALKLDRKVDLLAMFPESDHVVLDLDALPKRMRELSLDADLAQLVAEATAEACREPDSDGDEFGYEEKRCRFHASMQDFKDFIFDDVGEQAFEDNDVSVAYAETNAYIDEFYTDDYEFKPLAKAENEWTLVAAGTHTGEIDTERPYSGHAGNFTATYTFRKEGRRGLIEQDLSFDLDFSRSYE